MIETLETLADAALTRIWVDLNRWEWPGDLPAAAKPAWWDGHALLTDNDVFQRKIGCVEAPMAYIMARVGDPMIQAEWMRQTGKAAGIAPSPGEQD